MVAHKRVATSVKNMKSYEKRPKRTMKVDSGICLTVVALKCDYTTSITIENKTGIATGD